MDVLMACYDHKTCEIYKKCWEKHKNEKSIL